MNVFAFVLWDGNLAEAQEYLARRFAEAKHTLLVKNNLAEKSFSETIKTLRQSKFDEAFVFSKNLDFQTKVFFLSFFLILTGARRLFFVDPQRRVLRITRLNFFLRQLPCFLIEALVSAAAAVSLFTLAFLLKYFLKKERKLKFKQSTNAPKQNKNILFLRTEFAFQLTGGGSVTHINGIAKGFTQSGYNVVFIANEKMESVDYPTRVIPPSTFFINFPDIPQIIYNFKFFFGAIRYIREFRPALLYLRHDFYTLSGLALARLFKIPFILENNGVKLWKRSYWDKVYFVPLVRLIEDAVFSGCDSMVTVTETIKEECGALLKDKILVTPNAADPEMFYPGVGGRNIHKKFGLADKKIVAYAGTFASFHGLDILKDAIPSILSRRNDTVFLLVGDGEMRPDMELFIKENKWEDKIYITGRIPLADMPSYLDAAHILTAPYVSLGKGDKFFGSSVKQFEYMAMGKGIVASNIGQIGEILRHNETAILVEPGNAKALADAIIRLLEDDELCQRIGKQASKEMLSNYTWKKNVEKILRFGSGFLK